MQKHSLLVLHLLLAFIVVHEGLSFRGAERDNGNGRVGQVSGVLDVPAGCVDFTVLLEGPIIEYTSVISHTGEATDTASGDASQCLLAAEYPEHGHKDVQPQCEAHTLDVRENKSEAKSYTQLLRVQSSCSTDSIDLKVTRKYMHLMHRRLATDFTNPGLNLTVNNQTAPSSSQPSPTPPGPNPAPNSGVACCCGQNNQVGGSSQCCCGPISICCQSSGFCMTQNCTAIFVGSTLIAGALISFMTCGICIYRARTSIAEPTSFWIQQGGRRQEGARRLRRPLPVASPPEEEEGTVRECPVCMDEITSNSQWVIFSCRHAICRACYEQLMAKPHLDAACPLCRRLLTEVIPEEPAPEVTVQMQPLQREPADPSQGQAPAPASQPAAPVAPAVAPASAAQAAPAGSSGPSSRA